MSSVSIVNLLFMFDEITKKKQIIFYIISVERGDKKIIVIVFVRNDRQKLRGGKKLKKNKVIEKHTTSRELETLYLYSFMYRYIFKRINYYYSSRTSVCMYTRGKIQ